MKAIAQTNIDFCTNVILKKTSYTFIIQQLYFRFFSGKSKNRKYENIHFENSTSDNIKHFILYSNNIIR